MMAMILPSGPTNQAVDQFLDASDGLDAVVSVGQRAAHEPNPCTGDHASRRWGPCGSLRTHPQGLSTGQRAPQYRSLVLLVGPDAHAMRPYRVVYGVVRPVANACVELFVYRRRA